MAVVIERDPVAASGETYDLVIVGGGIYGVALTLEAARRGLRPVLLERDDFGGRTSWHSLRIVHGGLRYLQAVDLTRFLESVRERRRWLSEFPDLAAPLPCMMPLYGRGLKRPWVLRAATTINDVLSARRNDGVPADRAIGPCRVISVRETVERFPAVDRDGLRGAALWYDGVMPDSQRIIMEMLRWAVAAGATALNYVEATALLGGDRRAAGVRAVDVPTGDEIELRAPVVINCAGPWCREVARRLDRDIPELFRPSIAFNALLDRPPLSDAAVAVDPRSGGRTYFLTPWKGRLLAGTYHAGCRGSTLPEGVDDPLVERFVGDLNDAVPGLDLGVDEILRLHWGFLPAREPGTELLASREAFRDHGAEGGPSGLFSVAGVKFTTARSVAERVLQAVLAATGKPLPPPSGPPRPPATEVPARASFERLLAEDRAAASEVVRGLAVAEAVVRLDDVLLRRTDWGSDPRDGRRLGPVIADLLGWDERRRRDELHDLERALR